MTVGIYATPILYTRGIGIKMAYMTVFLKIISINTKIKKTKKLVEDQVK